ncbi:MAG: YoaK family protein [Streptosporangiaceae bacterium]
MTARGDGATAAGGAAAPNRLLVGTLIALTMVSGLTDAVSCLGFGHVFTANMTGNVVVLGFAAAGAPGFSATGCLTSSGCFLAGTVEAGRLPGPLRSRRTSPAVLLAGAVLVLAAGLIFWLGRQSRLPDLPPTTHPGAAG